MRYICARLVKNLFLKCEIDHIGALAAARSPGRFCATKCPMWHLKSVRGRGVVDLTALDCLKAITAG